MDNINILNNYAESLLNVYVGTSKQANAACLIMGVEHIRLRLYKHQQAQKDVE